MEHLKEIACKAIDENSQKLRELSLKIWENPEVNYQETKSHDFLTEFFKDHKFDVSPHWCLETAFCAKYGGDEGPSVGIVCEYDALPDIGHACGHNLIAEAGAGAALGMVKNIHKSLFHIHVSLHGLIKKTNKKTKQIN